MEYSFELCSYQGLDFRSAVTPTKRRICMENTGCVKKLALQIFFIRLLYSRCRLSSFCGCHSPGNPNPGKDGARNSVFSQNMYFANL